MLPMSLKRDGRATGSRVWIAVPISASSSSAADAELLCGFGIDSSRYFSVFGLLKRSEGLARLMTSILCALTWSEEVTVVCRRVMESKALGSLSLKSAGRTLRRAARVLRTAGEFSGGLQFGRALPA